MSLAEGYPNVIDVKYSEMVTMLRDFEPREFQNNLNVAFLRNITVEPLIPFFQYQCYANAIRTNIYTCDFDNIMQEVLDAKSSLYDHQPGVIFIFISLEQIAPDLCLRFPTLSSGEVTKHIENVVEHYALIIDAVRRHSEALIVFNNFEVNAFPSGGILDSQNGEGEGNSTRHLNSRLVSLIEQHHGVMLIDLALVSSRVGFLNYQNNMQWNMSKMPFSTLAMRHIAFEASKYITASEGHTKKCIVVDCDNTLWGGVVGEDGVDGIHLDQHHPGSFFLQFQRDLLNVKSQGVLLAICSKNNEADVLSVFENNPNMILKEEDFAARRINWNLKTENIKEIAEDLNLGLQHFVFIDDSEFEIEMVKDQLPEVASLLVPKNLSELRSVFQWKGFFDKLQETSIDSNRTELYRAENQRKSQLKSSATIDDYYQSLELVAQVESLNPSDVPRVAQLTQKTNQFNLTTIRYSEQEIEALRRATDSEVVTLKAEDRFGAYGLIGVAILACKHGKLEICSFLMSCRAIGRGLEEVLFTECIKWGKTKGASCVIGSFGLTPKNGQVENFFSEHGFNIEEKTPSITRYRSEIDLVQIVLPEYIRLN